MQDSSTANVDRRSFLKYASVFAVVPVIEFGTLGFLGCHRGQSLSRFGSKEHPDSVPWKATIVADGEPGEPLIVSGTIFAPDGHGAMEGITLWVYQTDATGHYSTLSASGGDNRNTRIHGLMRTNAEGRYEFRTIKPASYPGRQIPAHIHAYVSGANYPEYWIDDFLFEGDPFITEEMRRKFAGKGSFSSILNLQRGSDGVLRGGRDIKVERCTKNCTGR